ncbi:SRPBCC family protein [Nocardia otitidiscaviarum]|uniref:SRPBCC family protein n=1 Tax=Nocardia otitidiscaviarum TaxID=1823 RepID=UPI0018958E4D|nr:SRPBCC domain-containing protein [Nocardia otitidiscaviarum]MBF6237012.1 SRPBCC domain-containing protein [Nocardia otitidiscaviarum]
MSDDPTSIELDQFYPHPPAKVWRALTTPALMARWLMEPDGFEPVVGTRFGLRAEPIAATNFSGDISCEVLEAVAPKRLRISWDDANADRPTGWVITWDLHPEGTGTRVVLTHSGFDPDDATAQLSRSIMRGGWPGVLRRLDEALAAD